MTIRRGESWGVVGPVPTPLPAFDDDAALFRFLNHVERDRRAAPVVALTGGDLWRTLGGSIDRPPPRPGGQAMLLPVDLGRLRTDDTEMFFAAHVVARKSWWRGEVVAVMNAQFLGRWDVAARSHPNDGLLDVIRVAPEMAIGDRWKARRRLPTGTYLPHPYVEQRRLAEVDVELERPLDVTIDGVAAGRHVRLTVGVVPDGLTVVI